MASDRARLNDLVRRTTRAMPRLSPEEQRIALSVFRELGRGHPADMEAIGRRAGAPMEDLENALARWPGVFRDDQGRVVGFWGLGLEPTHHRIEVGERTVYAWCAWDALFLGELLGEELRVGSECGAGGAMVRLRAGVEGVRDLEPSGAVISFLDPDCCDVERDRVITSFCRHILFFSSVEAWSRWALADSRDTFTLTVEEGWRLGRLVNRLQYGHALRTPGTQRQPAVRRWR